MEITNERFSEIAKTMDECESCRFRFNEMCEKCTSCTPISSFSELMEFFGRLHKLAKAQEEGRLVELPCKAGDTVYTISRNKIWECKAFNVRTENSYEYDGTISDRKKVVCWSGETPFILDFCAFGKTAFLSRGEAEAALKE